MKKRITAVLVFALILGMLAGCGGASEPAGSALSPAESASGSAEDSSTQTQTNANQADGDMFTERDYRSEYDESASVRIELTGDTATASASGVQISGSTITLTEEATYIISGTLDDGMIIVNAPDTAKLQLVLDGVSIWGRKFRHHCRGSGDGRGIVIGWGGADPFLWPGFDNGRRRNGL